MLKFSEVATWLMIIKLIIALLNKYIKLATLDAKILYIGKKSKDLLLVQ